RGGGSVDLVDVRVVHGPYGTVLAAENGHVVDAAQALAGEPGEVVGQTRLGAEEEGPSGGLGTPSHDQLGILQLHPPQIDVGSIDARERVVGMVSTISRCGRRASGFEVQRPARNKPTASAANPAIVPSATPTSPIEPTSHRLATTLTTVPKPMSQR